ncbi:hypothetical protein EZS27_035136 [termite gut metagenome]|jgi:hypothetical protein|uniref:Clindamycin resistance transfer factor BtgB n=1 Tax=termite gut metagenome TaxID=433724 RepID=A0A5J4Q0T7_9ZZZZ
MERNKNKAALTTIGVDHSTNCQMDKLCKRYNLKKGEIVKLAFDYINKACINLSEPPESVKTMKRYIREVFTPEYAKNFNKGLSAEDIKFYGKIHFNRDRSGNELNMHCHLIVSRKNQSNKKKLSPLTNHKEYAEKSN